MAEPTRVGSPLWTELRTQAIARAGRRCEACHIPCTYLCLKTLSIKTVPLTIENVQAVCPPCLRGEPPKKFEHRGPRQLVFSRSKR
jgi:hypothetical protein